MMRSVYEENLAALKKKYPAYADRLVKDSGSGDGLGFGVAVVEDRQVLYAEKDGSQIQLDSLYESENMLEHWYAFFKGDPQALYRGYTVFGLGNGMLAKKLIRETGKDTGIDVIVYEPSFSLFQTVIRSFDLSALIADDRFRLYIRDCETISFGALLDTIIDLKKLDCFMQISYPNYPVLFPEALTDFQNGIAINAETVRGSMAANEKFGEAYYNNILDNFGKYLHSKSIAAFRALLPKELSAILVSSGPSLSKNIGELKRAKGHCLLIAVDSAMPILLHEGIVPDLYASIDGMKFLAHFEDQKTAQIPILTSLSATPGAVREGQTAFFERDDNRYIGAFLDEEGIEAPLLSTGGTVANTIYAFAEYLGVKSIILCGQDLAYTDDKAHAEHSLSDNNEIVEKSLTYTKDIYGETVKTSVEFLLYKDWFEREIAENKVPTIDATEGGAFIQGTEILTLKEAIDRECAGVDVDIDDCIRRCVPLFPGETGQKLRGYLESLPDKLSLIVSDAKKSLRNYEKMYAMAKTNQLSKGELTRLLKDNDVINTRLDHDPAMAFVEYLIQDSIRSVSESAYQAAGDVRQEILNASETGSAHAKAIIEKAEWIRKDLIRRDPAGGSAQTGK
ncbi:MAG: DUF115 domain-containing protein [Lachnospiraceae bacterium]|nr:DUF115 domain-containing protein [Lachnospiraceae bacterium]